MNRKQRSRSQLSLATIGLMLAALMAPAAAASDPNLSKTVPTQANFAYVGSFALPGSYSTGSSDPCKTLSDGCSTAFHMAPWPIAMSTTSYSSLQPAMPITAAVSMNSISTALPTILMPPMLPGCPCAKVLRDSGQYLWRQEMFSRRSTIASEPCGLSSGELTYGLYLDPSTNGMYSTHGDWYNAGDTYAPTMGYSTLNDSTGTATENRRLVFQFGHLWKTR